MSKFTPDELSLLVESLELKYASVKRALNQTDNPKLITIYDEMLSQINDLQRSIQNKELPL